jgi:hypothetical protein
MAATDTHATINVGSDVFHAIHAEVPRLHKERAEWSGATFKC